MKIISLNLQAFDNWESRQLQILTYLQQQDPDIIFFQEAVYLPDISPFSQVELLNKVLGYDSMCSDISRLQVGIEYPVYREGLACLSKVPIVKTDTIILEQDPTDEHNRILQLIDIKMNDEIMKFAHVHYSITDFTDFATPQLQETLKLLESRSEQRVIIGDFNLTYLENLSYLWQKEYNATLSPKYISYPSMNKRTDYALLPKDFAIQSVDVSPDGLSDHRALMVEFTIA